MALAATYNDRLNKNYEAQSGMARGLGICLGTLAVTYSAAGGLTWTAPFAHTVFVSIPAQSQYEFTYNVTTNMFQAWQCVVTTTASASCRIQVASDTDFTALSDSLRFCAIGFDS